MAKKFKKTSSKKIADIGNYEPRRETYTEDDKGDVKVRIMPPVKLTVKK